MNKIIDYLPIKKDDKIVGRINLILTKSLPEIEYDLDEEYWNQGIMTKALKEYLQLITKKFPKISALVKKGNFASQRVLEKNGFIKLIKFSDCYCYIIDLEASNEKQEIMRSIVDSGEIEQWRNSLVNKK